MCLIASAALVACGAYVVRQYDRENPKRTVPVGRPLEVGHSSILTAGWILLFVGLISFVVFILILILLMGWLRP